MWPTLLSFGPIALHSFGVMMMVGVFLGGFTLWQKGREESFEEELLMDVFLSSLLVGLIMGRVWFVFSGWTEFSGSFYKMVFLTKFPGIAYEGVLIGGLLGLVIFSLQKKLAIWKLLDSSVYSLVTIELFGYLGSFLAGSQLGRPTKLFLGIPFPGVEAKRFPVQLFFVLGFLVLYRLLKFFEKEYRTFSWYCSQKGEAKPGFLLASYLIGIGWLHLGLGFISEQNLLSFSSVLIIAGGLILLLRSGITFKRRVKLEKNAEEKIRRVIRKRKKKGYDFK